VRGANPADSAVFIDGVEIPLLYHFGGLISVVNPNMLERIDFYSGAVSFHKTVVELPGNNALRVAADYEYTVQEKLGWPPKYALRRAESRRQTGRF